MLFGLGHRGTGPTERTQDQTQTSHFRNPGDFNLIVETIQNHYINTAAMKACFIPWNLLKSSILLFWGVPEFAENGQNMPPGPFYHNQKAKQFLVKIACVPVSCESGYWKFEKWKVNWKSGSLISRSEKWNENHFHSFWEWKVKWKCRGIEIENEKWNENASRSRSEISREFLRIKTSRN